MGSAIMLTPKKISQRVYKTATLESVELPEKIYEYLKEERPKASEIELCERADKLLFQVKRELGALIDSKIRDGIVPRFNFSPHSENRLIPYTLFLSPKEKLPIRLQFRDEIYASLKGLTDLGFERLCLWLHERQGFVGGLTRKGRGKEGGIDFYATGMLDENIPLYKGLEIRVVGQARRKLRDGKVTKNEIKIFVNNYHDFLGGSSMAIRSHLIPKDFVKAVVEAKSPCIYVFLTNTIFNKGAKNKAESNKVILKNGEQITEYIVRFGEKDPWFKIDENGKFRFDKKSFLQFFNSKKKK